MRQSNRRRHSQRRTRCGRPPLRGCAASTSGTRCLGSQSFSHLQISKRKFVQDLPPVAGYGRPQGGTGRHKAGERRRRQRQWNRYRSCRALGIRRAAASTVSRWLIQICCDPAAFRNRVLIRIQIEGLPGRTRLWLLSNLAAQEVRHQLLTVADSEYGGTRGERSQDPRSDFQPRKRWQGRRR